MKARPSSFFMTTQQAQQRFAHYAALITAWVVVVGVGIWVALS